MSRVPPATCGRRCCAGSRSAARSCGKGALFHSYLKVNDACGVCGEELHHQRADDAPPYFTIMIVGHVVVGGVLAMEKAFVAAALGAHRSSGCR